MRAPTSTTTFVILVLLLASCAPPTQPALPVEIAPAPPPTAPPAKAVDPGVASVIAARVPARIAIDGDLSEWGSLVPPEPEKGTPKEKIEATARDALSRVAVAIHRDGLYIAADLGEGARDGVWVGLDTVAPELPAVGEYARFGVTAFMECMGSPDDPNFDPETDSSCKEVKKQAEDFRAAYARRFARLYRIDREGVRVAGDGGALSAVPGAKSIWKPGPRGATAEASLPAAALPRMAQAPADSFRAVARAVTAPLPAIDTPGWVDLVVPDPVHFEPWAALRAEAVGQSRSGPFPLSYQPGGDPLMVESMEYPAERSRRSLVARETSLYMKQGSFQDVEIGYGTAHGPILVTLVKGQFVALASIRGRAVGMTERDGAMHVFAYEEYQSPDDGRAYDRWSVLAVSRDGKISGDLVDDPPPYYSWLEGTTEHHDKGFKALSVRGGMLLQSSNDKPAGMELTWRWDEAKRRYVPKMRAVPRPLAKRKVR